MKLLVAEDQALVRQGIVALLSELSDQITEAVDGEQARVLLSSEEFDLVLLDIGLPHRTGLDLLVELRKRGSRLKVIMLTGDTHAYSPKQIYAAGADAFIYKTADASHFIEVCEAVLNGEDVAFGTAQEGSMEIAQLRETLTARELQILKLIVEGNSNSATAQALFISEHTVRKHREHINTKLKLRSPLALASFAIKARLV